MTDDKNLMNKQNIKVIVVNSFGEVVALKRASFLKKLSGLTTESVQSTSLSLQSIDDVHGCNGLSLSVFCVGNSISNNILEEHLENSTSLFVDEARDTLDTTTASKTTDGWFGDTLDVVTKDFPMALSTSFSETFASFATSRHDEISS